MTLTEGQIIEIRKRFWEKVRRGKDCWLWRGGRAGTGYGIFYMNREIGAIPAHRACFLLERGKIKQGDVVGHACDNRLCVRPDHLFTGSKFDNSQDGVRKGIFAGENHFHKLSEAEVREIRRLYDSGEMFPKALSEKFDTHPNTIHAIVKRRSWRHIP